MSLMTAPWKRRTQMALLAVALAATGFFGLRSIGTGLLLRSAYRMGAPELGNVRAWMTLGYVARLYGVPEPTLIAALSLPPETPPQATLRELADRTGVSRLDTVQRVQLAIAALRAGAGPAGRGQEGGWLAALNERLLAALLVYGYPALAATLVLGSIGLPLPDGLLAAAAGSLVAQGRMGWAAAGLVAVGATVAGDMAGYYLGRWLGVEFLERRGVWFGYTAARRQSAQALFDRWGLASVLLSRTLVSSVSSVVNLVAGAGRYGPWAFLGAAALGRVVWTSAYLGLGYGVAGALESADAFLGNLTGMLIALLLALWLWRALRRRPA